MAANLQLVIYAVDKASGTLHAVDQKAGGLTSMLGKVGAVGGIAAAAGLAVAAGAALKFMGVASDLNEVQNKSTVVFGDSAKVIDQFAVQSAKSLGIAKVDALGYASTLGTILNGSGMARDASAEMSTKLTTLAADMASFNNIPIADALDKIRAGLVGESEPLRTVGVLLSEAAVKAEAYAMGLAPMDAALTDAQKVQARYSLILKQTTDQQGDFARTSDSLANRQRILGAQWKNIQATLGNLLLPVMTKLAIVASDFLAEHEQDIHAAAEAVKAWASSDAFPIIERAFTQVQQLIRGIMDTGIIQWLFEHKEIVIALGIALLALAVIFGGPVTAIIALIAAGTLLLAHWDEIKAAVTGLLSDFTTKFPAMGAVVETVFALIQNKVMFVVDIITNLIKVATALWHGDFGAAWNAIKALFSDSLGHILTEFKLILDLVLLAARQVMPLVKDAIVSALQAGLDFVKSLPKAFYQAGDDIANAILSGFKAAWNAIAGLINSAIPNDIGFDIPKVDLGPLGSVGGGHVSINLPDNPIPKLAHGALLTRPTLFIGGETARARPEIVSPESLMRQVVREESGAGGGMSIDYERLAAVMLRAIGGLTVQVDGREIGRVAMAYGGHEADLYRRGG